MKFLKRLLLPSYRKIELLEKELKEKLPSDERHFFEGMSDDYLYSQALDRWFGWELYREGKIVEKLRSELSSR